MATLDWSQCPSCRGEHSRQAQRRLGVPGTPAPLIPFLEGHTKNLGSQMQ